MAFDPATATLLAGGGFDPSSAKPLEGGFDAASAVPTYDAADPLFQEAAKRQQADQLEAKAKATPRDWVGTQGSVLSDTVLSLGQGALDIAALPAAVYELAGGDKDNAWRRKIDERQKIAESLKSDKVKLTHEAISTRMATAQTWQEALALGIQAGADPVMAAEIATRMLPQMVGGGFAGRVVAKGAQAAGAAGRAAQAAPLAATMTGKGGAVTDALATAALKLSQSGAAVAASPAGRFAARVAPSASTAGAVGASAVIQGDSVGNELYQKLVATPVADFEKGVPQFEQVRRSILEDADLVQVRASPEYRGSIEKFQEVSPDLGADALDKAALDGWASDRARLSVANAISRDVTAKATLASLMAQGLPGGSAIETMFAKNVLGKTVQQNVLGAALKTGVKEKVSEMAEEGSGAFIGAKALQQVDARVDPLKEAAGAAGQAAAVSFAMGGAAGGMHARSNNQMLSFANLDGPASRAGIRPVVIPDTAPSTESEKNVSPSNAPASLAGNGDASRGDNQPGGLASSGRDAIKLGADSNDATEAQVGVPAAVSDGLPSAESAATVNPIAKTSDSDLLARVPKDTPQPATVLAGADGGGMTSGDARIQQEIRSKRQPDVRWAIEPLDNGRFRVAGYADETAINQATQGVATADTLAGRPTLPVRDNAALDGARGAGGGNEASAIPARIQGVDDLSIRLPARSLKQGLGDSAPDRASAQQTLNYWTAKDPLAYPKVTLGEPDQKAEAQIQGAMRQAKELFGISADVVAFSDPDSGSANGIEMGGKVYINTKGLTSNVLSTGWHETHHVMQARAEADSRIGNTNTPAQRYISKVDAIFDEMSEQGKLNYIAKFLHSSEINALPKVAAYIATIKDGRGRPMERKYWSAEQRVALNDLKLQEARAYLDKPTTRKEMMADFVGNRATDRGFIMSLAKADPKNFSQWAKKWLETIESLIADLRGKGGNTESKAVDSYVADLNQAKMVLRDAMVTLRKAGEIPPEQPDAAPKAAEADPQLSRKGASPESSAEVTLSAATSSIPGLKRLQAQANAGDATAQTQLNNIAKDSLEHLLGGIDSAKVAYSSNSGLYFGELEPSLGLSVVFSASDGPKALAALAKFAENYNQHQFHVRQSTDKPAGTTFDDGTFATIGFKIDLKRPLLREEVQRVIDKSGLVGLTFNDTMIEAYYVGKPENADDIEEFKRRGFEAGRFIASIGAAGAGAEFQVQRIGIYGNKLEGLAEPIPYESIRSDIRTRPAQANPTAKRVAERLVGGSIEPARAKDITAQQRALQERIAKRYEELPLDDLSNPDVRRAYSELVDELKSQFEALPIKVEVFGKDGEAYPGSQAMRQDVADNNHLFIYATTPETFGPPGVSFDKHPLLGKSGLQDAKGRELLNNDLLRAVHDYFAHTISPVEFGPKGEEAAWLNHMKSTASPWARWALTSETRGQNSWVNFRPGAQDIAPKERSFAEQKAALLPLELAMTGDPLVDRQLKQLGLEIGAVRANGSRAAGPIDATPVAAAKPSLSRRESNPIDAIDDLGGFNLDRAHAESNKEDFSFPDLGAAGAKLDAAQLTQAEQEQRLRDKEDEAQKFRALLERELDDAGFSVVGSPKTASSKERDFAKVTDAEIKSAGLMAEAAYPALTYTADPGDPSGERAFFVVNGMRYRASTSPDTSPKIDAGAFEANAKKGAKGVMTGYEISRFSEQAKKEWNQRFAASADLMRRGFDLFTAVPAKARDSIAAAWKAIATNPQAFEFKSAQDIKGATVKAVAQDIADKMMADGRYQVTIGGPEYHRGSRDFGIEITDTKTRATGRADVEFWQQEKELTMHTQDLDKGSGMGKPVYQIGLAFAAKFNARIESDGILLGANNYRRTEQMFSGALRSGNFDTMQPGLGQRIYGWNDRTKTPQQMERNLVRIALAATRNVLEFAPQMKDIGFDLATNKFYFKDKPDTVENRLMAGAKIKSILGDNDARVASISRSTLARAAITLEAMDGKVFDAESIAQPVLYSRKQRQFDERTDVKPMLDDLARSLKLKSPASIDKVMARIGDWRKSLDAVNEADFQDELIDIGARAVDVALAAGVKEVDAKSSPVPIGATPHVLRMLGFDMSPLRVDSRIVGKILNGKHSADFVGVTAKEFVSAIYNPVLVTRLQAKDEVEIVTSLTSPEDGLPVVFMVKRGAVFRGQRGENGATMKPLVTHALMSAYSKPSFWTIQLRAAMKSGALLYANAGELQALESKNPALDRVLSSVGASQYPDTLKVKPVSADTASLPPSSDGESPRTERANASIGSALSGLVAPSASRLTRDISQAVMAGNVKGYGDLVNFVSQNYNGDGDQMPTFSRKFAAAQGLPEETKGQAIRRVMQDKYIRVKQVQDLLLDKGGKVGEEQDVYRAEERMHGRVHEVLRSFADDVVHPLLKKAADMGVDLNELATYAYAKHAAERNAHIQKTNLSVRTGSGMSDAEAANIIQLVGLSQDKAKFEELHNDLLTITATTRRLLLDEGLIDQDQYDGLEKQYDNYVPLRGFEDVEPDSGAVRPGLGRGFQAKGKETIAAMGRDSKAGDIIENIIRDYERVTIRAERNSVGKTLLDLVTSNPDPRLWEVTPITRATRKVNGLVQYVNVEDKGEDTVSVKVAGQQVYIKLNDPLLLRAMQNAFKSEASDAERFVVSTVGLYTSLLRNTITRYNPAFGVINAVRDSQMGAAGVFDELGGEGLKRYTLNYGKAVMAAARTEVGKSDPQVHQMDKWMREMRFAGGTTGGVFMRDHETIRKELRDAMLQAGAQPNGLMERARASSAWAVTGHVLRGLEMVGAVSENAARLAAYASAREMGKTPAQAASIAKNLTVNFNRNGEQGQMLNTLFLFFNASVQGSVRIFEMLENPKIRMALAGVASVGFSLAMMAAAVGGDDEDGQAYWDKIPDFEKERSLIVMLPPGSDGGAKVGTNGRYIKIPMAYGLSVFPVLGYQLADLARNAHNPTRGIGVGKAAINLFSAVAGSYNPMGGSLDPSDKTQLAMAVSPTIVDVGIQLYAGVNSFGQRLGPEKSVFDKGPSSEVVSAANSGRVEHRLARWMNEASGGNQARSGAVDIAPGTIKNLEGIAGGGLGKFIGDIINLGYMGAIDAPVKTRDIPIYKSFYGELDSKSGATMFYDRAKKARAEFETMTLEMKNGIDRAYSDEQQFLYSMGAYADAVGKSMSALKKWEVSVAESDRTTKEKEFERREIQKQREEMAVDFNQSWYEEESKLKRAQRAK